MKDFKFYLKKVQVISESEDEFINIKSIIDDLKIAIKTNDLERIESAIKDFNNQIDNNLEDKEYKEIRQLLEQVSEMIKSSVLTKDTREHILNLYKTLERNISDAQYSDSSPFENDPQYNFMMKEFVTDFIKRNDVIYAFYIDSEKKELIFTDSSTQEEKTFIFQKNDTKTIKKQIEIKKENFKFNFKNVFDITSKNIELKLDIESPKNIKYSLQQKIDDKIINEKDITGDKNTENITLNWDDTLILTLTIDNKQKIVIQYVARKYS